MPDDNRVQMSFRLSPEASAIIKALADAQGITNNALLEAWARAHTDEFERGDTFALADAEYRIAGVPEGAITARLASWLMYPYFTDRKARILADVDSGSIAWHALESGSIHYMYETDVVAFLKARDEMVANSGSSADVVAQSGSNSDDGSSIGSTNSAPGSRFGSTESGSGSTPDGIGSSPEGSGSSIGSTPDDINRASKDYALRGHTDRRNRR